MKYSIKNIFSSQLFRNSYWSLFDLGIYPLLMIIATPYFIHHLGVVQYGLWMLIGNVTQLMNAMNMGVGDGTIRQVSKFRARGEKTNLFESVNANFSLSIILFLLACFTGYILSFVLSRFNLFHINDSGTDASILLRMASLSAGLKFIESVLLSVFKGMERFDISARLSLVSRNSVVLVALLVLSRGFGLSEIIEITVMMNVINIIIQLFVLRKVVKGINLLPKFQFSSFGQVFFDNGWYWLQSVIALFGFLSDKFLVAYFTDLKTLGYYSIASMIASQVHNILLAFGAFIFPKVSLKNEQKADTVSVYYVSRFGIAGMGWLVLGFLYISGPWIFEAWLGADTYFHASGFINLYLGFEAVILLIIVPYHFLNGSHLVKLNSLFEFILRASQIVLMLLMFQWMGSTGLIWGQIIATLMNLPFQYIIFHRKVLGEDRIPEAVKATLPAFVIACILAFQNLFITIPLGIVLGFMFKKIYFDEAYCFLKTSKI